jgi:hypothetical protein
LLKKAIKMITDRDWRITLGALITILWIVGGIFYVVVISGADSEQAYSMDVVGSFLEGAFAPLAFMWLVLGMFIQQEELANNTEAIRRTVEQSEIQTQALLASEMNARQETFFKIAEEVKLQLGGISGMLLMSSLGPPGSGRFDLEKMDEFFASVANGDASAFARQFLMTDYDEEGGLPELFYGTEIRRKHTKNYQQSFERLCRLARNCDVDNIIEDALIESAFGLLYQRMVAIPPPTEKDAS